MKKEKIIITTLLVVFTATLLIQVALLNILATKYLLLIIVFVVLLDVFLILLNKKTIGKVLTILIIFLSLFGNYYLLKTSGALNKITRNTHETKSTISIISLKDNDFDDLNNITIGYFRTDLEEYKTIKYNSLSELLDALYGGEVDAIIINEAYRDQVKDIKEDFDKDTKVIYQTSMVIENTDKANKVENITNKSFNVLISGSDTRGGFDEYGRSDVIMVATVNPNTHTILLTSIPRDYYVTTICDENDRCMYGELDKITHTGIHGTNTTKRTVENLLGIKINYTFKVGFDTVTDLVDAIGGVDIYVEPGYALTRPEFSVKEGLNHLNGKQALAYSRERYAYSEGDRQRTRNQQQVLMGIIDKLTSPSIITNYAAIIDAMADTFSTTMSNEEITSLIKYQLDKNPKWTIEQYMVDGSGSTQMCAELGDAAYVMIPNQDTVRTASERIEELLK